MAEVGREGVERTPPAELSLGNRFLPWCRKGLSPAVR